MGSNSLFPWWQTLPVLFAPRAWMLFEVHIHLLPTAFHPRVSTCVSHRAAPGAGVSCACSLVETQCLEMCILPRSACGQQWTGLRIAQSPAPLYLCNNSKVGNPLPRAPHVTLSYKYLLWDSVCIGGFHRSASSDPFSQAPLQPITGVNPSGLGANLLLLNLDRSG